MQRPVQPQTLPWGSQSPDLLQAIVLGQAAGVPVAADGDLHGGCLAQDPVRHPQGLRGHRCGAGARTTLQPGAPASTRGAVLEGDSRRLQRGGRAPHRQLLALGRLCPLPRASCSHYPAQLGRLSGHLWLPERTRRVAHPRGTDPNPSLCLDPTVAPTPSRTGLPGYPTPWAALRTPSHKPRRGSPRAADPAPGQRS